jgi:hypothetical protein
MEACSIRLLSNAALPFLTVVQPDVADWGTLIAPPTRRTP